MRAERLVPDRPYWKAAGRTSIPGFVYLLGLLIVVGLVAGSCGSADSNTDNARPAEAAAVRVLEGRPGSFQVATFDGPGGDPLNLTFEYVDGNVIDWPLYSPTQFDNTLALPVATGEPGDAWAEVHIATRPATTAWVRTDDFSWSLSDHYVHVDVFTNTITVWDGDEVILQSGEVSAGAPESPTPLATAYVDEIIDGPSDFYGPKIISLTLFSESLNSFRGGIPKVALHGTDAPELLGQHASNGCIRLDNAMILLLAELLPVGTRVDLVSSA